MAFLLGGGARADIQSLLILRPLAVLACGFGLWTLRLNHVTEFRFIFAFAGAVFALVVLHLVPLPPAIWGSLPGRELLVEADRLAGLGPVWRPISIIPSATWNVFYSLFVPLAVLLIGVQVSAEDRQRLLPFFLGLGVVSGILGLLQVVGSTDSPFYMYRITNNGSAVGLFSNRNHQAIFLATMFPMLAVFASTAARTIEQSRFRLWSSIAVTVVLIPLLLVTGSRAGLIIGLAGLASAALLYRKVTLDVPAKRKVARFNLAYVLGAAGVLGLGLLTVLLARAEAFERLMASNQTQDLRFAIWGPVVQMAINYFPFGSGIGSFVEVYQINEPLKLLSPRYVNHVHNDFIEVFFTGGLLAICLVGVALLALGRMSYEAWFRQAPKSHSTLHARLGSIILTLLTISSVADYPLRVPSIMAFASIAVLWMCRNQRQGDVVRPRSANRDGSPNQTSLAEPAIPKGD